MDYESSRLSEKEAYFREFSVWPIFSDFDSEGWLENFHSSERRVAERLLTNFTYFNEYMTDALIRASIQKFLSSVTASHADLLDGEQYLTSNCAFVICEGEEPSPTDSGHLFARKLRDKLGIPEVQILRPSDALEASHKFDRFIFVDDFTGSGNQFLETWCSEHSFSGIYKSFKHDNCRKKTYSYCCCVATKYALQNISAEAPMVNVHPAHELDTASSAVSEKSRMWDGVDAKDAIDKIKQASQRAGYSAEDGGQDDWRGYHKLGLTLAFNHGIPDACLPIFFSQRNGWKPLIKRPDHG